LNLKYLVCDKCDKRSPPRLGRIYRTILVLDVFSLPPLAGAENDNRPIAAVFASQWRGAMAIHAGAARDSVREVGAAAEPAVIGELIWAQAVPKLKITTPRLEYPDPTELGGVPTGPEF